MALEAQQLTQTFADKTLYKDLELQIRTGESWGILGVNGSGKSTLLHTLAGLLTPTSGRVILNNSDIGILPRRQVAKTIGVLLQQQNDEFPVSVLETALAGLQPHLGFWGWESRADIDKALSWLQQLGLDGFQQRPTHSLSGGERQRLAIATLLMQQSQIALLDEPDNHLDPEGRKKVMDLLIQHFSKDDRATVMSLHDVNLANRYCSHILMLGEGGEWRKGICKQILNKENLEWLYRCHVLVVDGPDRPLFMPGY